MTETFLSAAARRDASGVADPQSEPVPELVRSEPAEVTFVSVRFVAATAALAAGTVMADLSMPGVPGAGVVHVALLVLAWWLAKPAEIVGLAVLATGLVAAGHVVAAGGALSAAVPPGRILALFAVWTTAALLVGAKRRERALRTSRDALIARVRDHAAEPADDLTHGGLALAPRSALLSDMSHELRTPLNAIIGFSDIGKREMFGSIGSVRYREYMQDINASGRELLGLLEDLLDAARVETGKVDLQEEAIDVPGLIRACVADAGERARAAGVAIEADAAEDLPPLRADPPKVRKVLAHLVSNAIRFTPGRGAVKIAAWARPDSGYVIQVADSGYGIPLEAVPLALAPCGPAEARFRAGRADQPGLGLPLAKALVELHGGSFDLQSAPGAGTTVTLRFPAQRIGACAEAAE